MNYRLILLLFIVSFGWAPRTSAETPICETLQSSISYAATDFSAIQGKYDREWEQYEVTREFDQLSDCTISVDSEARTTEMSCIVQLSGDVPAPLDAFSQYLDTVDECLGKNFHLVAARRPDVFAAGTERRHLSNRWYRPGDGDKYTEVVLGISLRGPLDALRNKPRLSLDIISGRQLASWTFDPELPGRPPAELEPDYFAATGEQFADLASAPANPADPTLQALANTASGLFKIEPIWFQTGQFVLGERGPFTPAEIKSIKESLDAVADATRTILNADPTGSACRKAYWYTPFSRVLDRPRLAGHDDIALQLYEAVKLEILLRRNCNYAGAPYTPLDPASGSGADLLGEMGLVFLNAQRPDKAAEAFSLAYQTLFEMQASPYVSLEDVQLYGSEISFGLYDLTTDLALCATIAALQAGLADNAVEHAGSAAKSVLADLENIAGYESDARLTLPVACAGSQEVFDLDPAKIEAAAILVGENAETVLGHKQQVILWMRLWSWLDTLDLQTAAQFSMSRAVRNVDVFGAAPPGAMADLVSLQLVRLEERRAWREILDLIEHSGDLFRTQARADLAEIQMTALLNLGLLEEAKRVIEDAAGNYSPDQQAILKFALAEYFDRTAQPDRALEEIVSALSLDNTGNSEFNIDQMVLMQAELFQQASKTGDLQIATQAIAQLSTSVWPHLPDYNETFLVSDGRVKYQTGAIDPDAIVRALNDRNVNALIGAAEAALDEWDMVSAALLAMSGRALSLGESSDDLRPILEKSVELLERPQSNEAEDFWLQDHFRRLGLEMAAELAIDLRDEPILLLILKKGFGYRADFGHVVRRASIAGIITHPDAWIDASPPKYGLGVDVPAPGNALDFQNTRLAGQIMGWPETLLPKRSQAPAPLAFDESIERSAISLAQEPVERQILGEALLDIYWHGKEQHP